MASMRAPSLQRIRRNKCCHHRAVMSELSAEEYARTHLFEPVLTQALAALSQEKPANPTKWLAEYLLEHNPNKPHVVSIGSPKMASKGHAVSTSSL